MTVYPPEISAQLRRAIPGTLFDAVGADPLARLCVEASATLAFAGVSLASEDADGTCTGLGARVEVSDQGEGVGRVVLVTWWAHEDAVAGYPGPADVMLGAVVEVLWLAGFTVKRHPFGLSYIVTGRAK